MRYTFNAPGGGDSDLYLRGSTNIAGSTKYDSIDLKITTAVTITLNGTDITSLFEDQAFKGVTSTTPDPQNRTGEVNGMSLEGRYRFVNWTTVKAKVSLNPGENVLMIKAKNKSSSGHWDSIKFDCKSYKTPLAEIAHAEVENDENVTLKNCYSLRQLKDTFDYKTAKNNEDYVDIFENKGTSSNCPNAELHAKGFLGYEGKYKYSGKGFVLGFDSNQNDEPSKTASMTYRFNSSKTSIGSLVIRAASNDTDNVKGKYQTADIKLSAAVDITLNGVSINDKITDSMILVGNNEETAASVNRSEYDSRYRFLNWTEIEIPSLSLEKGVNELVITAKNSNKSGQWDSITVKA